MNLCPPGCLWSTPCGKLGAPISVATPCLECQFMSWANVWSMESWVPLLSLHVCPSHLISVATPCLECVHASVHEFMSLTCLVHPLWIVWKVSTPYA